MQLRRRSRRRSALCLRLRVASRRRACGFGSKDTGDAGRDTAVQYPLEEGQRADTVPRWGCCSPSLVLEECEHTLRGHAQCVPPPPFLHADISLSTAETTSPHVAPTTPRAHPGRPRRGQDPLGLMRHYANANARTQPDSRLRNVCGWASVGMTGAGGAQ
ncbi:hypothetical protein B0H10DRAFT_1960473 [Mycena sp. CBHHK59/15]|nr:hypothetical protein B0H10DRAFT_1960473 [Mycena sp. CBHHK59/15]